MAHVLLDWLGGVVGRVKQYRGYVTSFWAVVLWLTGATLMSWWFGGRDLLTEAGVVAAAPAPELVVVALDERFAEHHDFPEETPKDYLAEVVRTVASHGPRVVALDYWLTNADLEDPGFDSLRQAVASAPPSIHFVFPTRLLAQGGGYTVLDAPPAALRRHVLTGYAELWGDPVMKARLRRPLATAHGRAEVVPSFALAALAAWTFPDAIAEARAATTASVEQADSAGVPGRFLEVWQAADERLDNWVPVLAANGLRPEEKDGYPINYRDHFTPVDPSVLSSEALLRGDVPPALLDVRLRDKLVIIGSTYPSGSDTFGTPFGPWRGVLVHANILNSILAEDPLRPAPLGWVLLLMALAFVLTFLSVRYLNARRTLAIAAIGTGAYLLVHFALFVTTDRLLPLYEPIAAGLMGAAFAYWTQRPTQGLRRFGDALDLSLRMTPELEGYRVAVVAAPDGVQPAEAVAALPLDEMLPGGRPLSHGLKRMARGAAEAKDREVIGGHLFRRLFPGPVLEAYRASRRSAHRRGWRPRALRVHLHIEDPRLEAVPWEHAYDPSERVYLAAAPDLLLTRCAPTSDRPRLMLDGWAGPLKVLTACPDLEPEDPRPWGLPVIDVDYERALLDDALGEVPGLLHHSLDRPALPDLAQRLEGGYGIVHFVAPVVTDGEEQGVVLEDTGRGTRTCRVQDLAESIPTGSSPHTLVLDATPLAFDLLAPSVGSLAAQLATATGSSVLAVPAAMPDAARQRFLNTFYRQAATSRDIEQAFAYARLELAGRADAAAGMPVLWQARCESASATDEQSDGGQSTEGDQSHEHAVL